MLSPYTAYTLSVAVAHMFPVHVQRYYNSVLEPFFTMAVPALVVLKGGIPAWLLFLVVVACDILLCGSFVVWALAKVALPGIAAALAARAMHLSPARKN